MPDRVLWVGGQVTGDPRSGGALRTARLLEGLRRYADVDVVATDRASRSAFDRALVLANAIGGKPVATARACPAPVVRTVRRLERTASYVVVEWIHLYPLVPKTGPYVLSLHNVEAERLRDLPPPASGIAKVFAQRDARRLTEVERDLVRDPRATVVAVSERDAEMLGPDVKVVPNGTDLPSPTEVPETGDLVFVGAMDYAPNRLAVDWWAKQVWPLLPAGTPPLSVAGRAADRVLTTPHPGVRVLGEVASVAPVLEHAALVVVPLHHGGGTRLKVLEAFAANRPVLSTAKGVEGLDVTGGVDCVLADEPAAFASAVTTLLADAPRRRALATAGRAIAEAHAWGPIADRFAHLVLASPRRG
jgi:glycosyltransferase involved in cell wall biosynthesis